MKKTLKKYWQLKDFDCKNVMDGDLGCFPGLHKLQVNPNIMPIIINDRRFPISGRSKLKDELDRMTKMGVIQPIDEPTAWLSHCVVSTKKDGNLRVCINPKELNKALLREHYILPVLDDVLYELGQSTVFSKADLASGYWHVKLDEESSKLTAFQTCFGRYIWLRLPFGLSVSSEIFQKKLHEALQNLPGTVCVADDIIIHGKDIEEHDKNLEKFFERCSERKIQLNKEKFILRADSVSFLGHLITKNGLRIDPAKVEAINNYPAPTNLEELHRFLGMVNYLAKFLPNSSTVLYPLQNLLKKNMSWMWSEVQENAFLKVKEMLVSSPILAFYDPTKELVLENDASDYGVGSVLLQQGKPVAYSSRSLSPAEKNYAQIEKEMLAIVYGLEKFHHYTFGRQIKIITDHKPLVSIVCKPLASAPKRLQSMILRTQRYSFTLEYRSGKEIPIADALSRAPVSQPYIDESAVVNSLQFTPVKPQRLEEMRIATENDENLKKLKNVIMSGWPNEKNNLPDELKVYFSYRDEFTIQDGIILRGERIVIPGSLRAGIKEKLHLGHLGINSCLRRARDLIFWPGMSSEIRQYIEGCEICASSSSKQTQEPLIMHDVPSRAWQKVGIDIFTIAGRNYLITVDYFSQFFEVDFLTQTDSSTVIHKIKHHFARYGIPDKVISDNAGQFNSFDFKKFEKKWGFTHEPISPGNSKSNGAVEAAVKIAKHMMKKCAKSGEDHYLGLLNIRNTIQEGLDYSPAQRLFGRRTKTIIPTTSELLQPKYTDYQKAKMQLEDKKVTTAGRFAGKRTLKPLNIGDTVRMQPIDSSKSEWKEATVSKKLKSRTYEVKDVKGHVFKRNRQHLRKFQKFDRKHENGEDEKTDKPKMSSYNNIHSSKNKIESEEVLPKDVQLKDKLRESDNVDTNLSNNGRDLNVTTTKSNVASTKVDVPIKTRSGRNVKVPDRLTL